MKKHKVVVSWTVEDGVEYDPIYADTEEEAERIAYAMLQDSRRAFDELRNIRTQAMKSTK